MSKRQLTPEDWRKLDAIAAAMNEARAGQPVTTRCPVCGEVLEVEGLTFSVWVRCKRGCTRAHFNMKGGEAD